jgi:uncharacterized protein YcbK (DUF882 family)
MEVGRLNVGHGQNLRHSISKAVATAAIAGTLAFAAWMGTVVPSMAGGDTRTISMYHQHTKESITVTYKKDGRYVPSAMKQLNRFLRDWRRNETVTMDPRTIDLIWDLHAELGSKKPVYIVCGYRSSKTNSFLKRIGRNVAKKSQHTKGKAIDFFFPDVSTLKIRNMALAHQLGGVGYYRSSGGPTGFLHADSGNVRHWGPQIRPSELASIIKNGRKKLGKRSSSFKDLPETQVADAGEKKSGSLIGWIRGDKAKPAPVDEPVVVAKEEPPIESIYSAEDDDLADMTADAAQVTAAEAKAAKSKKVKPVSVVAEPAEETPAFAAVETPVVEPKLGKKDVGALAALSGTAAVEQEAEAPKKKTIIVASAADIFIPKPRLKPKAVLALAAKEPAADDVVITPVSAGPEPQTWVKKAKKPSPVAAKLATLTPDDEFDAIDNEQQSNVSGKTNLRSTTDDEAPVKRSIVAVKTEPTWINSVVASADANLRKHGARPAAKASLSTPVAAVLGPDGSGEIEVPAPVSAAEGKGDALSVNREGKTSLPPLKLRLSSRAEN